MGQGQSGLPGQPPGDQEKKKEKKKYEPPAPATRVGKKLRKHKGSEPGSRLPTVTPASKCKLRLLKLERIKDYLLMEEEFVTNQERFKPQEEKNEEDRSKVRPFLRLPQRPSVAVIDYCVFSIHVATMPSLIV